MSRRKQSNPKPLKSGEEENWSENEGGKVGNSVEMTKEAVRECAEEMDEGESSKSPPPSRSSPKIAPMESEGGSEPDPPLASESETKVKKEPVSPTTTSASDGDCQAQLPSAPVPPGGKFYPNPTTRDLRFKASEALLLDRQGFLCPPCGIRFSSASTLEAHQTYYCSHRSKRNKGAESEGEEGRSSVPGSFDGEDSSDVGGGEPHCKSARVGKQYRCTHCSYSADKKVSLNRHMRMHSVSPASVASEAETPAIDRYCQECDIRFSNLKTFRAHKMHYCSTRNVLKSMPSTSPVLESSSQQHPSTGHQFVALPTNPILIVPYSLIRGSSVLSENVTSGLAVQDAVYLLLPDGALQIVSQGMHARPPVLQPIQAPLSEKIKIGKEASICKDVNQSPSRESPTCPIFPSTGPLDLRLHKNNGSESGSETPATAVEVSEEEKENRRDSAADPEDIVCAPSIPLMLSTSSSRSTPSPATSVSPRARSDKNSTPSPKLSFPLVKSPKRVANAGSTKKEDKKDYRLDVSPATRLPSMPDLMPHLNSALTQFKGSALPLLLQSPNRFPDLLNPAILPLLTPEMAMRLVANANPANFVRQGTWKCEECNIGFCKYENYMAHKKHYCSSRKTEPVMEENKTGSVGASDAVAAIAAASVVAAKEATTPVQIVKTLRPPTYPQFPCPTCGIKFTSLDNLTTHQTFYCPNRVAAAAATSIAESSNDKSSLKCSKCKVVLPSDQLPGVHQCGPSGWKCPCCLFVCANTSAIQKHMECHTGIKAFLCTICNYKGNTIRGMRTHIRVHFDKRNGDITEENYITCILEDSTPNETETVKEVAGSLSVEAAVSCNGEEKVDEEDEYIDVDEVPAAAAVVIKTEISSDRESENEGEEELGGGNNAAEKKCATKYCESCDISFNYLSTFIAHKKYYCTDATVAVNGDEPSGIVIPTNITTSARIM